MLEHGDAQIFIYRHIAWNGTAIGLDTLQFNFPVPDSSQDGLLRRKVMQKRHRGKENMVFVDGHTEHGKLEKFHWQQALSKRWNRENLVIE
jgi:prepilin-type processing-associated H-X9-DG protein